MSRRDAIKMTGEEVGAFLEEERVVIATTNGVRGWPHSMPLWYTVRAAAPNPPEGLSPAPANAGGVEIWAWTFGKSQKVKNLERDPRTTLLVEAGDAYEELRGVMIESEAVVHRDFDICLEFGKDLYKRYSDGLAALDDSAIAAVEAQASKRVAIQFHAVKLATWDHRKLGGTY